MCRVANNRVVPHQDTNSILLHDFIGSYTILKAKKKITFSFLQGQENSARVIQAKSVTNWNFIARAILVVF